VFGRCTSEQTSEITDSIMNRCLSVVLIAAAGVISVSLATHCFVCNSEDEPLCAVANITLKANCQGWGEIEDGGCSTMLTMKGATYEEGFKIKRTCGQIYNNNTCTISEDNQDGPWSCSCEGDDCNSITESGFAKTIREETKDFEDGPVGFNNGTPLSLATSLLPFIVLAYM